ncbi:DUF7282 domain-containing protein [Limimaricola pyoseonensis]|uniref:DUF7282 domain-containing protein n=1 Tax=Limimaricola pyoseonensis TaxID=521013 RepID=A0A1G7IE68_9RHOB|nr:hypothetical protein [Limimaricola pyoseonensis]SDF11031.1 hypothetical protein SAMN04488567_3432 [Limimaricola pyoseonensis]
MIKSLATATAAAALVAGAAFAQDDMEIAAGESMMMATADGQTMITFPMIRTRQDGYIVVHAVENGAPVVPESIAHAPVMAGENMDVMVTLPMALEAGTELVGMLHAETNGNGTYDFGDGMTEVDTPVVVNGAPVTVAFAVPAELMVMEDSAAAMIASPEDRAESDDPEDPDYRDDGEEAIDPNTIDETGFGNEEDDEGSAGDDDDAQN